MQSENPMHLSEIAAANRLEATLTDGGIKQATFYGN